MHTHCWFISIYHHSKKKLGIIQLLYSHDQSHQTVTIHCSFKMAIIHSSRQSFTSQLSVIKPQLPLYDHPLYEGPIFFQCNVASWHTLLIMFTFVHCWSSWAFTHLYLPFLLVQFLGLFHQSIFPLDIPVDKGTVSYLCSGT